MDIGRIGKVSYIYISSLEYNSFYYKKDNNHRMTGEIHNEKRKGFTCLYKDDRMSTLAQYFEENRELAYKIASENTPCNANSQPVITKDDEWRDESEWDEMFLELSKTH